ncbi:MAG TPA: hypothetical protein VGV60_01255 [Candidatus Polarisedimenticolia bacterium]|nr:hypothetical protein [Candidatus Polarisedimenticolia bacterium]
MFISGMNAADLLLPCLTWAGDAVVRHGDGRIEMIRDVITKGATESGYAFKVSFKPAKKLRKRRRHD